MLWTSSRAPPRSSAALLVRLLERAMRRFVSAACALECRRSAAADNKPAFHGTSAAFSTQSFSRMESAQSSVTRGSSYRCFEVKVPRPSQSTAPEVILQHPARRRSASVRQEAGRCIPPEFIARMIVAAAPELRITSTACVYGAAVLDCIAAVVLEGASRLAHGLMAMLPQRVLSFIADDGQLSSLHFE